MPKIIVREYDETKSNVGLYSNFAVLVPGIVRKRVQYTGTDDPDLAGKYIYGGLEPGPEKEFTNEGKRQCETVFDENGVYECHSQKDFLKYIGRVSAGDSVTLRAAKNAEINWADPVEQGARLTKGEAFQLTLTGFTPNQLPDGHAEWTAEELLAQKVDFLKDQLQTKIKTAPSGEGKTRFDINKHYLCIITNTTNSDPLVGEWITEDGKKLVNLDVQESAASFVIRNINAIDWNTEVTNIAAINETTNNATWFVYLPIEAKGCTELKGAHYGNQIAYELLGLGYTVLFKKFDSASYANLLDYNKFWSVMADKSLYDFRYVLSGFNGGADDLDEELIKLVNFINKDADTAIENGRGDCIALLDVPTNLYSQEGSSVNQTTAVANIKNWIYDAKASKYAAYFAPYVEYNMKTVEPEKTDTQGNANGYSSSVFPASFHYLACAAKAAERFNEWYAVAGYSRGICDFPIKAVGCKFGETAVNAVQPRYILNKVNKAINLITCIKGNYYLWGNRTAELLGKKDSEDGDLKASHFLNIRQLCTTIKKQVYITCKKYTYDPNSDILWGRFCADLRPLLEKMKHDQGISDYKFVKINAKQKAILKAKIRIVPIEAVEDFDISLTLEDSVAGIVAIVD